MLIVVANNNVLMRLNAFANDEAIVLFFPWHRQGVAEADVSICIFPMASATLRPMFWFFFPHSISLLIFQWTNLNRVCNWRSYLIIFFPQHRQGVAEADVVIVSTIRSVYQYFNSLMLIVFANDNVLMMMIAFANDKAIILSFPMASARHCRGQCFDFFHHRVTVPIFQLTHANCVCEWQCFDDVDCICKWRGSHIIFSHGIGKTSPRPMFRFLLPSINVCVLQSTMLIMFVNADGKANVFISSFHTVSILALAFMLMPMPMFWVLFYRGHVSTIPPCHGTNIQM